MFKININGSHEFFSIKECANRNLYPNYSLLQLKNRNFLCPGFLIIMQHLQNIFSIFIFSNEKQAFNILSFSAWFDYISSWILLHKSNCFIKRSKMFIRNDWNTYFFQFFLAKRTIIFQHISIRSSADNNFSLISKFLGFSSLS